MVSSKTVSAGINGYHEISATAEVRSKSYQDMVIRYFDLATVFYEWGWGSSFHFANRAPHESFDEAVRRHEYMMASHLRVFGKDKHVLDVGCGIGGPMRNICKFLGCRITGITINPYQVGRGNHLNAADPQCASLCRSVQGDFMKLPFEKESFDAAYALEATPHAPDHKACYKQIFDVLKPGAYFVLDEWCMTDLYDETNSEHRHLKNKLEYGSALPDVPTTRACLRKLEEVGFEVVLADDLALKAVDGIESWLVPFLPSWSPLSIRFQFTWLGEMVLNAVIVAAETLRLAPSGTVKTQKMLKEGAVGLRDAGLQGIFTATYIVVAKKPETES